MSAGNYQFVSHSPLYIRTAAHEPRQNRLSTEESRLKHPYNRLGENASLVAASLAMTRCASVSPYISQNAVANRRLDWMAGTYEPAHMTGAH